jgi:hypothetical protein
MAMGGFSTTVYAYIHSMLLRLEVLNEAQSQLYLPTSITEYHTDVTAL